MLITITREFNFSSAHYLHGHPRCGEIHGHNYKVLVEVAGPIRKKPPEMNGMIIDFSYLKEICFKTKAILDHQLLNGIIDNPTVENIAHYIADSISGQLGPNTDWPHVRLTKLVVYETEKSFATIYTSSVHLETLRKEDE